MNILKSHLPLVDKEIMNINRTARTLTAAALIATGGAAAISATSNAAVRSSRHTVVAGDTIASIAATKGISTNLLLDWNLQINRTTAIIHPGNVLSLPSVKCLGLLIDGLPHPCAVAPTADSTEGLTPKQRRILANLSRTHRQCLVKIIPAVEQAAGKHQINSAAMAGQALLESGSCKYAPGGNLWGIKGRSKRGKHVRFLTHEQTSRGRIKVRDTFRAYDSTTEAAMDYAELVTQRVYFRDAIAYAEAGQEEEYLQALQNGTKRYATDRRYVRKVMSIIDATDLTELFTPEPEPEQPTETQPQTPDTTTTTTTTTTTIPDAGAPYGGLKVEEATAEDLALGAELDAENA